MSVDGIKSAGYYLGRVITFPFEVGFGAADGVIRGTTDGFFKTELSDLKDAVNPTKLYTGARKPVYSLFASGLQDLNAATNLGDFTKVMKSDGFGKACSSMLSALSKMRGSGFVMLGVVGAGLLASGILGWKGFSNTRHIIDEHDRGHTAHIVKSNLFHVAQGIGFVGMIGGPLLCLTPIGAAAGLSLAAASAITAGGLAVGGWAMNGFHMFNYPEKAGFLGRRFIRLFNEVTGKG